MSGMDDEVLAIWSGLAQFDMIWCVWTLFVSCFCHISFGKSFSTVEDFKKKCLGRMNGYVDQIKMPSEILQIRFNQ